MRVHLICGLVGLCVCACVSTCIRSIEADCFDVISSALMTTAIVWQHLSAGEESKTPRSGVAASTARGCSVWPLPYGFVCCQAVSKCVLSSYRGLLDENRHCLCEKFKRCLTTNVANWFVFWVIFQKIWFKKEIQHFSPLSDLNLSIGKEPDNSVKAILKVQLYQQWPSVCG